MTPARYDIDDGVSGNTWRYAFDFVELGANYLDNLASASFLAIDGCGARTAIWDLDDGLSVDGTVLKIEPSSPLTLLPGQYKYAIRLTWVDGMVLDVIEGYWLVGMSLFAGVTP